ncbi:MAG: LytTR family DNA-binding domain-containing protein [Muribaculaceae bacterium]|nr:LytTR family DNA-binding domain-containing protein [Muribaculaceae bacterium]
MNKTIRCIAIDDEPIALSIIREYCGQYGNIELECYTSPLKGIDRIVTWKPDILFLDIEMNSHNGIQIAKELPQETAIIFTTAYSQYAIDGFNVDAVDFLHKPIFYPRFCHALEKAVRWIGNKETDLQTCGTLTLKVEHKNVVVYLKDILYIEAMDNYVKVYRKDLPTVLSQITMKEMETMLPENGFIRVHRSYIVALNAICKFSNRRIFLYPTDKEIPVGRKYTESFKNLYNIFKSKKQ